MPPLPSPSASALAPVLEQPASTSLPSTPVPVRPAARMARPSFAPRPRSTPRLRTIRALPALAAHAVPVVLWLILFSAGVALIPAARRPSINVTLLPALDARLGRSYTWFANDGGHPTLDLLAAVPYTIHPLLPLFFIVATCLLGARPGLRHLPRFVLAFGLMNLAAVLTHLAFPTAPPWYLIKYGTAPASYDMKGDPAVLARLDHRFNMTMYHRMYAEGGKVVFGAWPSLHAAWPYFMARFRPPLPYRSVQAFQWAYAVLVWWAAIYLQHHFALDVVGGILYAELAYAAASFLAATKWDPVSFSRAPFKDDVPLLPIAVKR